MDTRCRHCAFPIAPRLNVMLIGVSRRLQGTCWSVLICFCKAPLGGSKTRMESSAAKNTPFQINEILYIHVQQ